MLGSLRSRASAAASDAGARASAAASAASTRMWRVEDGKWDSLPAQLRESVRDFDEDKSVTISRGRFGEVLRTLDATVNDEEINALFEKLDKNQDGAIDYEEFMGFCRLAGDFNRSDGASNNQPGSESRARFGSVAAAASAAATAASSKAAEMWDQCPLPSRGELQRQFEEAAGSDDKGRLNALLDSALATHASEVPGVRKAAHQVARQQLTGAVDSGDRKRIKGALIAAQRLWATDLPEYQLATQKYRELARIPDGWDVRKMVEERKQGKLMVRAELNDPSSLALFQRLFDATVRMRWTRDRRDDPKVPTGYDVVKVMQVQNEALWTDYVVRQEEIRGEVTSSTSKLPAGSKPRPRCSYGSGCYRKNPTHKFEACHPGDWDWDLPDCKAIGSLPDSQVATEKAIDAPLPGPLLDDTVKEVFLFHGTNPIAVEKITSDNFSVNFAGSSAGSLYGRGLYFAEHITKADEYAKADPNGVHTVLVCRVTLGNILYTADAEPDARDCEEKCMGGVKHSVLGDRIKCRDTFREFVVFDEGQIYASFVVQYRRRKAVQLRK